MIDIKEVLHLHYLYLVGDSKGIRADLREANLSRADLREADLRGADLREANLSRADLSRADLRGADLREANLSRADLREANLSRADLREANLSRADLREADLRGADLRGANLRGADLGEADLRGADLREALHDLKILATINGLEYPIVFIDNLIQVGCQKHSKSEWLNFIDSDIEKMDGSKALLFYPTLVVLINHIYRGV